jgi:hypothetical protein
VILTAAAADTEDEIETLDAARAKAEDRAPKLTTRLVVCGRPTTLLHAWVRRSAEAPTFWTPDRSS